MTMNTEQKTPSYVYNIDELINQIRLIKQELPNIPLTYSIKSNSFIINAIDDQVNYFEVCSPGELQICKRLGIDPDKIIYSGVMKEEYDIRDAIAYKAHILTAESLYQYNLISSVANEEKKKQNVILRISSGNQFGMEAEEIYKIIQTAQIDENICIYGFHYYSGTQKKKTEQIESDIKKILTVVEKCARDYQYRPRLVEYGPGLAVEYFKDDAAELDHDLLKRVAPMLLEFAKKVPLGIELGRFISASCGTYFTKVMDIKNNNGINYVILDGGIHHIKYYGQIMSMNSPNVNQRIIHNEKRKKYCLCGSLCTVADVLIKEIELNELFIGDILEFKKCGAYSLTEASGLFLSRMNPCVYLEENKRLRLIRGFVDCSEINTIGYKA